MWCFQCSHRISLCTFGRCVYVCVCACGLVRFTFHFRLVLHTFILRCTAFFAMWPIKINFFPSHLPAHQTLHFASSVLCNCAQHSSLYIFVIHVQYSQCILSPTAHGGMLTLTHTHTHQTNSRLRRSEGAFNKCERCVCE